MNLGPHAAFIWWAYGIALFIVLMLIAWTALDYRAQRRQLARLEEQGVARRATSVREQTAWL
jgi:heme exporter protein D